MDEKLVSPCGLNCNDCIFFKDEIYETAKKLKRMINKYELNKFLSLCSNEKVWKSIGKHLNLSEEQIDRRIGRIFTEFVHMPFFMNVLENIINLQCKTSCKESGGCSIGGNTHECKALVCIKSKEYEGCWQCSEFQSCDKLFCNWKLEGNSFK